MGPLSLAFTLLPLLELLLLVRIGRAIGAGNTLLLVIATGFVGLLVAKTQGRKVLRAWQGALAEGRVPERGVLDGVLILVGALLLITPGVLTDVLGLLCLVPVTRHAIAGRFERYLAARVAGGQVRIDGFGFGFPPGPSRGSRPSAVDVGGPLPRGRSRFGGRPTAPRPRNDDIIDTEGEEV
ncbi:MAG: FxsA family protein [Polyangiales bacterium]